MSLRDAKKTVGEGTGAAMTREQAKELASDLYAYYLEQGSPTPATGKSTGWDEVWVNRILDHVNEAAPPAVWSRQKPTEPGWYWWRWRANAPQHLVEVSIGPREVMWSRQVDTTMEENVSERGGEWAGPLRPPVEGKG